MSTSNPHSWDILATDHNETPHLKQKDPPDHLLKQSGVNELSLRGKITNFFKSVSVTNGGQTDTDKWLNSLSRSCRAKYESFEGSLSERISAGFKSGVYWDKSVQLSKQIKVEDITKSASTVNSQNIQNMEADPILMGADVIGLYPNLDTISVAKVTADTVLNSKVTFSAFNFTYLMVYLLLLVLGATELHKAGLGDCIPRRKNKSESRSLCSKVNKDMDSWDFSHITLDERKKRRLISTMVHVMVLLLTSTTCYTFGGQIYRQKSGLGIGLRGSAALARIVMCAWDKA